MQQSMRAVRAMAEIIIRAYMVNTSEKETI
jgi:hypothetical protein